MKVLGIETSCDDTSVAIVDSERNIFHNAVQAKLEEHQYFGGVVPEIASRNHLAILPQMIEDVRPHFQNIDAIAVTQGPGLIGGLVVGVMMAKSLAFALNKPIVPINHLEGHLLTNRMCHPDLPYPFLALLVSGGHCQFILATSYGNYKVIGKTLDDAAGEAFDKVAKMLGLSYPGGPIIERCAKRGNGNAYKFPMPLLKQGGCDLSFSGLKTAVKRQVDSLIANGNLAEADINNIAASFQHTVSKILAKKLQNAIEIVKEHGISHFAICGGVSANQYICGALQDVCSASGFKFYKAPLNLCVDNAAMIAWAAIEKIVDARNLQKNSWQNFDFAPQSTMNIERL